MQTLYSCLACIHFPLRSYYEFGCNPIMWFHASNLQNVGTWGWTVCPLNWRSTQFLLIRISYDDNDGQRIQAVSPYDHNDGQRIQAVSPYDDNDGQRIQAVSPYDDNDGQRIQAVSPYDENDGQRIQAVSPYDDSDGQRIPAVSRYDDNDGQRIQAVSPYDDNDGQRIQAVSPYDDNDGRRNQAVSSYDDNDGQRIQAVSPQHSVIWLRCLNDKSMLLSPHRIYMLLSPHRFYMKKRPEKLTFKVILETRQLVWIRSVNQAKPEGTSKSVYNTWTGLAQLISVSSCQDDLGIFSEERMLALLLVNSSTVHYAKRHRWGGLGSWGDGWCYSPIDEALTVQLMDKRSARTVSCPYSGQYPWVWHMIVVCTIHC